MNSEELELSLRTEFENYLKDVFAGMQQDVADFQKNFEAEFDKHKAQMDDAFRNLSARFQSDLSFDRAFTESVVEHLRLARDDGAQLSAQAFSDAQQLEQASAPAEYDRLRDAINDISGQTTQTAILRSLVNHASHFTSRGAFFVVKHDNFVCWRRFDGGTNPDDESVREIHFPVSADTLLADAIGAMRTKDNSSAAHTEDSLYLDPLGFSQPDRMYAVPLVARGRGVAVLYVDGDVESLEAIESLVRVAGLTVELRAASAGAAAQPAVPVTPVDVPVQADEEAAYAEPERSDVDAEQPSDDQVHAVEETYVAAEPAEFEEYSGEVSVEEPEFEASEVSEVEVAPETTDAGYFEPAAVSEEAPDTSDEVEYADVPVSETISPEPVNDFAFASSDSYDASADSEPEPVEDYAYASETNNGTNGRSYEPASEPMVEVATAEPLKSRLSDRNVDLPIEVGDGDERRLHNDARRFARLLVSEIKLYNEQRVNEGREVGDLYDRLREAIDRSREMYDKRVKPEVAAKFDYFHYELVGNLAEGNAAKLGTSYPGANV